MARAYLVEALKFANEEYDNLCAEDFEDFVYRYLPDDLYIMVYDEFVEISPIAFKHRENGAHNTSVLLAKLQLEEDTYNKDADIRKLILDGYKTPFYKEYGAVRIQLERI